jgi:hypothetical protein
VFQTTFEELANISKNVLIHGCPEGSKYVLWIASVGGDFEHRWSSAANATRALNSAVCLRRVRRPDFLTIENSFSPSLPRPSILPGVSTYRTVQNSEATSMHTIEQFCFGE